MGRRSGGGSVAGRGAWRWATYIPEVPGLPRIAFEEAEAASVRGQPSVRGRRAEVELGRAAVKRLARWRDPPWIGMRRVESRLLRVGAIRRGDGEREPIVPSGVGEPVEGDGHIGAHRLALAVG